MRNKKSLPNKDPHSWVQMELVRLRTHTVSLFIFIFTVIGVLLGYYIFGGLLKSPFTRLSYALTNGTEINVNVGTKFPARTKIEYGTTPAYVNSVYINNTFETDHVGKVDGLLPDKEHIFRIVAQDNSGRTYYSNFYSVK